MRKKGAQLRQSSHFYVVVIYVLSFLNLSVGFSFAFVVYRFALVLIHNFHVMFLSFTFVELPLSKFRFSHVHLCCSFSLAGLWLFTSSSTTSAFSSWRVFRSMFVILLIQFDFIFIYVIFTCMMIALIPFTADRTTIVGSGSSTAWSLHNCAILLI